MRILKLYCKKDAIWATAFVEEKCERIGESRAKFQDIVSSMQRSTL